MRPSYTELSQIDSDDDESTAPSRSFTVRHRLSTSASVVPPPTRNQPAPSVSTGSAPPVKSVVAEPRTSTSSGKPPTHVSVGRPPSNAGPSPSVSVSAASATPASPAMATPSTRPPSHNPHGGHDGALSHEIPCRIGW